MATDSQPQSVSVLVVDDDDIDRHDIRRLLRNEFDISEADSGTAATRQLEGTNPDCVLLDYRIPGTDTLELLGQVVARQIPVIMLTGQGTESVAVAAMKQGAEDYLLKSDIDQSVLADSIRAALRSADRRKKRERSRASIRQRLMTEIRHRRELSDELELAAEIQQNLMPDSAPEIPGLDIAGMTVPATSTSGDFYDYLHLSDGSLGVVVGDASGHGLGPALIAAKTRAYFRAFASIGCDVRKILAQTHDLLSEDLLGGRFTTAVFVRIDLEAREIEYSCAGHDAHLLQSTGPAHQLASTSPPLGIGSRRQSDGFMKLPISSGDILLLTSDGLSDCRSVAGQEFGPHRACTVLQRHRDEPAAEMIQHLYQAATMFCQKPQDDITIVAIKFL